MNGLEVYDAGVYDGTTNTVLAGCQRMAISKSGTGTYVVGVEGFTVGAAGDPFLLMTHPADLTLETTHVSVSGGSFDLIVHNHAQALADGTIYLLLIYGMGGHVR